MEEATISLQGKGSIHVVPDVTRITIFIHYRGKTYAEVYAKGKVKIGFTKQMCIYAWGEPKDVNTTTTRYGKREQWVYYDSYLYFENGKLTSIQN